LLFIPCSDRWLELLATDLARTLALGRLVPAERAHLDSTLDKVAFTRQMASLGLPHPETYAAPVPDGWQPARFPFVLKPSSTYRLEHECGVKALVFDTPADWERFDRRLLKHHHFLAQACLPGASLSVCFCTTAHHTLAAAYCTD
jgi:predicted ATP-grasp superfamily ATP-dependent carboligase